MRRTGKQLKKSALAKAVGVSDSSVYAYLKGTTLPPTDVFDRILDVLGVPAAERRRLATARDDVDVQGRTPVPQVPRELPPDVFGFTGRVDQLAELDRMVTTPRADSPAVVISAVSGTAGVGKTALAVHWAHRSGGGFPDGTLYVDLRGYDTERPVQPAEALEGLLRSLGVAAGDIPPGVAQRAARYRTALVGRRMLIVLDNAGTVDQVRDLLPGTPSCFVVVTSRDSLAGLVARHGAHRIDLDLLPLDDAVTLLRALIGDRVDADRDSAAALAERCARLPLALRIAAELANTRPDTALADLLAELDRYRLDMFGAGGDQRTAIRTVFSWSCRQLPGDAAPAFGLLGLHPGADLDVHATAALTGAGLDASRRLLDTLAAAHLIHPTGPGRYGMHDLLRAYAAEQVQAGDARAALTDLFDYYLYTTVAAVTALYGLRLLIAPGPTAPTGPVPPVSEPALARAWLAAERPTLVSVATYAAGHGWPGHSWELAEALERHLSRTGDYSDALTLHTHARAAARDGAEEGLALINLGRVRFRLGRYREALDHHERALALLRAAGHRAGIARALNNLGTVTSQLGHYTEAAGYFRRTLDAHRELGDAAGEARALNNLGVMHLLLGDNLAAADHLWKTLAVYQDLGDVAGEAQTLHNLGRVFLALDRPTEALGHFERTLDLYREQHGRVGEAKALTGLGAAYARLGRFTEALDHHRDALATARDIGDPNLETAVLNDLAEALAAAGQSEAAATHYESALALAGELGDRYHEGRARAGLGRIHHERGQVGPAREEWEHALKIFDDLGLPEAGEIRQRLSALEPGLAER